MVEVRETVEKSLDYQFFDRDPFFSKFFFQSQMKIKKSAP